MCSVSQWPGLEPRITHKLEEITVSNKEIASHWQGILTIDSLTSSTVIESGELPCV